MKKKRDVLVQKKICHGNLTYCLPKLPASLKMDLVIKHYVRFSFLFVQTVQVEYYLSRVMRKPAFCICENKDADQLRGNREADQRLCFRYIDSSVPLLSKSEISSL